MRKAAKPGLDPKKSAEAAREEFKLRRSKWKSAGPFAETGLGRIGCSFLGRLKEKKRGPRSRSFQCRPKKTEKRGPGESRPTFDSSEILRTNYVSGLHLQGIGEGRGATETNKF